MSLRKREQIHLILQNSHMTQAKIDNRLSGSQKSVIRIRKNIILSRNGTPNRTGRYLRGQFFFRMSWYNLAQFKQKQH